MRNRRLWTGLLMTCLGMSSSVVQAQDLPEGPDQGVLAEDPPEDGIEEGLPESPAGEEAPVAPIQAGEPAPSTAPAPDPLSQQLPKQERYQSSVVPGSLWNEASARRLIGMDGSARMVGDLITVSILESTQTVVEADTASSRTSKVGGGIKSLFGLESSILGANTGMSNGLGLETEGTSSYDGEGKSSRAGTLQGTVTCQVTEVLVSGNLRIEGWKQLKTNRETQYLVLKGIVRPRDIQMDNIVASDLLAELEIEYAGAGVIADKQGPGVGQRIVDHVWPF